MARPKQGLARVLDFGFENIDLWRSEEMQLVQLLIPSESAKDVITALGDVGLLQFRDLNADKSAFQRSFANQVKRCDEMARRLRFFHEQVEKAGLALRTKPIQDKIFTFDELEAKLEELEKEMLEMNANTDTLQRNYAELQELQLVLEKAGAFFSNSKVTEITLESFERAYTETQDAPLLEAGPSEKVARVGYVAGTIQQEKIANFERLLFRATRGNMYLRQTSIGKIRDPATGEEQQKCVFAVFFAGERSKTKVTKICEAFNAARYPFPDDAVRQSQMRAEVTARLRELHTTNEAGERRRDATLQEIAAGLEDWSTQVRREKAVYHTMNKLSVDVTSKVLVAEAWIPQASRAHVQEVLRRAGEHSHTQISAVLTPLTTSDAPPTFYKTTKFTGCFQQIIESYGIARYREVNPAVLTLMTFPFLFAVMFGDVGHAALMIAFAAFLVIKENQLGKQDLGDMLGMLFGGRYCILLMGIFSIYTGLIYNEFFSIPMAIFGNTRWRCVDDQNIRMKYPDEEEWATSGLVGEWVDPRDCGHAGGRIVWPWGQKPYVFGMDPIWHSRRTELPFFNSVKMKMSIIIGVTHMNFGILNSLFNNMFYKDTLSTIWEFIPQVIFLDFIFGYLSLLIWAKWFSGSTSDLYSVMIYMFLGVGAVKEGNAMWGGQAALQKFLLFVALLAVPAMLLPKPLILKKRHEATQRARGHIELGAYSHDDEEESRRPGGGHGHGGGGGGGHGGGGHGHGEHGEFDFGEVMVHQMIHTIEFVLGAVSNTASYLRLWALSLAHSQLSSVFFDRVLMYGLTTNNVAGIFIGFFVFACATLGVLMVMESLSAFLHALRLHWVEYMGKFYKGDGYKFTPFSFEALEKEEKE